MKVTLKKNNYIDHGPDLKQIMKDSQMLREILSWKLPTSQAEQDQLRRWIKLDQTDLQVLLRCYSATKFEY